MRRAVCDNMVKPGFRPLLGWWNPGFTAFGGAWGRWGRAGGGTGGRVSWELPQVTGCGGAACFLAVAGGGRLHAEGGDRDPARRSDVTEDTAATTAVPGQREPDPARLERETSDHVKVCRPADGAYLSVLRTATAGLAARLDFTLDEIEDLRIAVDEACAMLLVQAIPGTNLECDFDLGAEDMTITVSVIAAQPRVREYPCNKCGRGSILWQWATCIPSRLWVGCPTIPAR